MEPGLSRQTHEVGRVVYYQQLGTHVQDQAASVVYTTHVRSVVLVIETEGEELLFLSI